MSSTSRFSWYVATLNNFGEIAARENLQRQGFQTFSPRCLVRRRVRGTFEDVVRPYFPGYIFVRLDLDHDDWGKVYGTRGVKNMIPPLPAKPVRVPERAMKVLFDKCNGDWVNSENIDAALSKVIPIGSTVRLLKGTFAGDEVKVAWAEGDRVKVLMSLLGAEREVKLRADDVELVS